MNAQATRLNAPDAPSTATPRVGAGPIQLRRKLRGRGYAESAAMLSPSAGLLSPAGPAGAVDTSNAEVQREAEQGVAGSGGSLPHLAQIQRAFGRHRIDHVQAYVGGGAGDAAAAIGADAYATGDRIAFVSAVQK